MKFPDGVAKSTDPSDKPRDIIIDPFSLLGGRNLRLIEPTTLVMHTALQPEP